jgi:regulator of protease activity HflC (stomatin/prohibitin superfamily)
MFNSVVTIDQTERGLDYKFREMMTQDAGQLRQPGLSFKLPFVSSVKPINIALQQRDYENVMTYTKDNQVIDARLSVMFRIPEGKIIEIYSNNPDWESKLEKAVLDSAKSAFGRQEAQNVAQNREKIMEEVTQETAAKVRDLLGLEVQSVLMPNFDFDDAFEHAVSQAANAKAELNRKQTELEQQKVEKEKTIVNAEASAEAQKKAADAEAYQISMKAKADADGLLLRKEAEAAGFQKVVNAIGKDNIDVYLITGTWDGKGNIVPTVNGSGGGGTIVDLRQIAPQAVTPAAPRPAP